MIHIVFTENLMEKLLARFNIAVQGEQEEKEKPEQLLEDVTFEGIAKFMKTEKCNYYDMYLNIYMGVNPLRTPFPLQGPRAVPSSHWPSSSKRILITKYDWNVLFQVKM